MAAFDALNGFVASLSNAERLALKEVLKTLRAEMLAARSEDARVRLVHDFIDEAREIPVGAKKG